MSIRLRHLSMPRWTSRFYLPASSMKRIKSAIADAEEKTGRTIVFAFESSFTTAQVIRGVSLEARAKELFGRLHVWDTADNNGMLLYLNLADPILTVIADRGLQDVIDESKISAVNRTIAPLFNKGKYLEGVLEAISSLQ